MIKKLLTAIAISSALILSACNKDGANVNKTTTNTMNDNTKVEGNLETPANAEQNASVTENAKDASPAPTVSREEAYDKFLESHKNAKIRAFELTEENDKPVYKIKAYDDENEYETAINTEDASIIKDEKEAIELDEKNNIEISKEMLKEIDKFIEKTDADVADGYILNEYKLTEDDGKLKVELEYTNKTQDISYEYDFETEELIEKDM